MDVTKCRNANRQAGEPLSKRGTCLRLWRRGDVRDTLYRVLTAPSYPRLWGMQLTPSGPVNTRSLTDADLAELLSRLAGRQRSGAGLAGVGRVDPVLDAWVEMLLPRFDGDECCFFTGTYRDAYGYPNGLMKADNVLRDFKRFLSRHNLENSPWVVCAEPHQERDIWHCHALIANCSPATRDLLKADWTTTRGWADAPQLHDGGVSYTTKYALKGSDAVLFDWNLS